MDIQQIILNFLAVLFSLVLFFLFKSYWPKYFESKGANQATKEDIGEITKIVEIIKSNLVQQNELLKAQLSLKNQHIINLKTAEMEAIFDFNKRISAWVFCLVRFTFSGYKIDNYKEIKLMSAEFAKRQYECDLAEAHIVLFMHDKEFIELKRDLIMAIIQLEGIVEKSMINIYYTYSKCEFNLEYEKNNPKKQSEIRVLLNEELKPLLETYRSESIEQFALVHRLQVKMTALINKRLKELEDNAEKLVDIKH